MSLRDERLFGPAVLASHRQVTDVYLLGLAVSRQGRLATFDRAIRLSTVRGARPSNLAILTSNL